MAEFSCYNAAKQADHLQRLLQVSLHCPDCLWKPLKPLVINIFAVCTDSHPSLWPELAVHLGSLRLERSCPHCDLHQRGV